MDTKDLAGEILRLIRKLNDATITSTRGARYQQLAVAKRSGWRMKTEISGDIWYVSTAVQRVMSPRPLCPYPLSVACLSKTEHERRELHETAKEIT
eukprot:2303125-Rhodomonas_salina.2